MIAPETQDECSSISCFSCEYHKHMPTTNIAVVETNAVHILAGKLFMFAGRSTYDHHMCFNFHCKERINNG